jgi:hypothetical protein
VPFSSPTLGVYNLPPPHCRHHLTSTSRRTPLSQIFVSSTTTPPRCATTSVEHLIRDPYSNTNLSQVVDGRFHQACCHFVPLSTHFRDCLESNCIFSSQHRHPPSTFPFLCFTPNGSITHPHHLAECASNACIHHMTPSAKNPIRLSPSRCPKCSGMDTSRPMSPSSSGSSSSGSL